MKPEELQIGDWVMYKSDAPENAFPIKVDYNIFCNELNKWEDRFEAIQLTKEILYKNGFENIPYAGIDCNEIWLLHEISYYGKSFPLYTDDIMLRYSISKQCWYIFFNIGGTYSDFKTITNIFYVHELQHVLKLCGIEKEIIL